MTVAQTEVDEMMVFHQVHLLMNLETVWQRLSVFESFDFNA